MIVILGTFLISSLLIAALARPVERHMVVISWLSLWILAEALIRGR